MSGEQPTAPMPQAKLSRLTIPAPPASAAERFVGGTTKPYPTPNAAVATSANTCVGAFSIARPAPVIMYPMTRLGRYPRHDVNAVLIHTPQRAAKNCTVKNNPACVSLSDHREMKSGKIGPMITVGMPVSANPAASKASQPLPLLVRLATEVVAAMGTVILKEHRVGGNVQS
jgi:hypothetical protein